MGLSLPFAETRILDDAAAYPVMQKVAPSRNRRITRSTSCQNLHAMKPEGARCGSRVIFNPQRRIVGLDDSKKLTAERRADSANASASKPWPEPSRENDDDPLQGHRGTRCFGWYRFISRTAGR